MNANVIKHMLSDYVYMQSVIANDLQYLEQVCIEVEYGGKAHKPVESKVTITDKINSRIGTNRSNIAKIDLALNILTETERNVITEKYIRKNTFVSVSMSVCLSERQCIRVAKTAVDKMVEYLSVEGECKDD